MTNPIDNMVTQVKFVKVKRYMSEWREELICLISHQNRMNPMALFDCDRCIKSNTYWLQFMFINICV